MTRFFKLLVLSVTALASLHLGLGGCNNGSLLPNPSESLPLGMLELSSVHQLQGGSALPADGSGAKVFSNDLDFQITLTHATLGYQSLGLVSSGADPECVGGNDVLIALNGSDDLLGEDLVETSLGAHAIPLASFCSYTLTLGPAVLAGTWSKGGAETPFEIEAEDPVVVEGIFPHPLHFHEGETETSKTFSVAYDALFDGIDFETMDPATITEEVLLSLETVIEYKNSLH